MPPEAIGVGMVINETIHLPLPQHMVFVPYQEVSKG